MVLAPRVTTAPGQTILGQAAAVLLLVFLGSGTPAATEISEATETQREQLHSLLAATTPEQRAKILQGQTDQQISSLRAGVAEEATRLLLAGESDAALHASELALELAERLQEKPAIVQSLTLIGKVRANLGRLAEAAEILDKAARLAEEWDDRVGLASVWTQMAFVALWRGDFEKARDLGLASLAIFEQGQDKERIALTLTTVGHAMMSLGSNRRALDFFERALRLYKEAGQERATARPLHGMGGAFQEMGDYARALHYYRQALAVSEAHDDKLGVIGASIETAAVFRHQGDYHQALEHQQRVLRLAEEIHLALAIMSVSTHMGETYRHMGDPARAQEAFSRALAMAREMGSKVYQAQVLLDMGIAALEGGDVTRALELLRTSVDAFQGLNDASRVAFGLASLAEALLRAGRTDEALDAAERASRLSKEVENLDTYWQARWRAARIHRARGKTGEARTALDEAIGAIEELRHRAAGGEVERGVFFENLVTPYYDAADLAESAGDVEAALSYAERAKARILLDSLRNGRPDLDESLTSEERATRETLRSSMRVLNRRIAAATTTDPALTRERQKLRQEYAAFEARLYAARPELRLQQGDLTALAAEEMTELLPGAERAVVEFAVLDERVLIFVITRGSSGRSPEITVHSRDIARERLREHVRGFAEAVAGRRLDYAEGARSLYHSLLRPIEGRLRGRRDLVIVPDDVLWELPFAALKPDARTFLVERHALSYAPSLSALREMGRASAGRPAVRTFLGVGDPALPASAEARRPGLHRSVPRNPLPEAVREIRALGRMYGDEHSTLLTGKVAREGTVKRALPQHDVVHLATHGIFDDVSPLYSQVVLAQGDEDADEDGLLEAWEILSMKLKADLVVLSACQTARGRVGRGEGVIGMSWALLVAGCPTTVVSQWNVESRSTAKLMVAFHRALRKATSARPGRVSKAEALQIAQRELLRTRAHAHPFYWAAFSVVGTAF